MKRHVTYRYICRRRVRSTAGTLSASLVLKIMGIGLRQVGSGKAILLCLM